MDFSNSDCEYIFSFCPSDIADNLVRYSGSEEKDNVEYRKGITDALYQIKAMSENEYNYDYWRMLAHVLYNLNDRMNSGDFDYMEDEE